MTLRFRFSAAIYLVCLTLWPSARTVAADPVGPTIDPNAALTSAGPTIDPNAALTSAGPTIDVWYGPNQSFGLIGQPQPWVNILGNVSDPQGIASLDYSLNSGPAISLNIGSDGRRLLSLGDFNIDIATTSLSPGANTVTITAIDGVGSVSVVPVAVNYSPTSVWPGTYSIDWSTLTSIEEVQDVAQVVDGKWTLDNGNIRTLQWGYDRLISIGDVAWRDYEVTVPVTIHTRLANHGVGILFRWDGHTDDPVVCSQPKCGWFPLGAILWYEIGCMKVWSNGGVVLDQDCRTLLDGVTYWFKARVETNVQGGLYSFKIWEDGQSEPPGWDISGQASLTDPQNGSILLLAHMADVSFGNVTVTELQPPPNQTPIANNDRPYVVPGDSVNVDVLQNDSDPDGILSPASITIITPPVNGSVVLNPTTGIITYTHDGSGTTSDTFTYTVDDNFGATSNEATVMVTVTNSPPPAVFSDDFNRCTLDGSIWSFVNPLGDGWCDMVGGGSGDAALRLSLPAGTSHDVWGGINEVVRVMQPAYDADFDIIAKFNHEPVTGWNNQGILVQQDATTLVRCDVYHDGTSLHAFFGCTIGTSKIVHADIIVSAGSALYLRVIRVGDSWTMKHSADGVTWSTVGTLTQPLVVSSAGVFAGNPVTGAAYTAEVDYFEISDLPLASEDSSQIAITLGTIGGGNVSISPNLPGYACNDTVVLTAIPDTGWVFDNWSGDLSGSNDPDTIQVGGPMSATAIFSIPTGIVDDTRLLRYELLAAHPNPFNPSTRIPFRLPRAGQVNIDIFDVAGRRVRTLLHGQRPAGDHSITWDGRNNRGERVSTGVYFYRMQAGTFRAANKLVLIK